MDGKQITNILKGIPAFLLGYLFNVVLAIVSDIDTLTIAILGVIVGFVFGPLYGLLVAWGAYVVFRMVFNLCRAIFTLATAMNTWSQTYVNVEQQKAQLHQPPPPPR